MIHSADWGDSPRWAAFVELFILSTADKAVACSGPYSPSTFCELAAAIAALRRALRSPPPPATPTWRAGPRPASVFWCPEFGPKTSLEPPACCETVVIPAAR
mmetsp:Transcript_24107/g.75397  ORF Transcript_24107/g.75397 Transcript_24107/m.75397 type:complete len:102 (-) Transcript_24107:80-385(-)